MCYFLCLSLPYEVPNLVQTLGGKLILEDASATPIGKATRGNRIESRVYVLTNGGCSCCILGKNHNTVEDGAEDFIERLKRLLEEVPSVSLLLHTFRADWRLEEVPLKEKRLITLENFAFPNLEENIRYVIKSHRS